MADETFVQKNLVEALSLAYYNHVPVCKLFETTAWIDWWKLNKVKIAIKMTELN